MGKSHLDGYGKAFGMVPQSRRAALCRVGLGGLATGLLTAVGAPVGAPVGRAQESTGATPPAGNAAATDPSVEGVTGGLPPFAYALEASEPRQYAAGTVRWGTKAQLPTLHGAAMAAERIDPNGLRELHWHLNAHELSYVLAGQGRMGIFSPDGPGDSFDLQPGSISFVPEGSIHYIQNTGDDELHLVLAFTHEQPETIDLSQALPSFPQHLLAETFGVSADQFPFLATRGDRFFVPLPAASEEVGLATPVVSAASPFSIHAEQVSPTEFAGAGGTVRVVSPADIPRLAGITVFPLHAVPQGLREPHWHPNTSELNYCVSGRAQIGLVAPDGSVQTFAVEPGTIAFIPTNWFHYIANVTDDPLEFLVFFVNAEAKAPHIDLSQMVGYFPPAVLAASFGVDPAAFAALPKRGDVFLAAPVEAD
jgi:oxalate decarboxylase